MYVRDHENSAVRETSDNNLTTIKNGRLNLKYRSNNVYESQKPKNILSRYEPLCLGLNVIFDWSLITPCNLAKKRCINVTGVLAVTLRR